MEDPSYLKTGVLSKVIFCAAKLFQNEMNNLCLLYMCWTKVLNKQTRKFLNITYSVLYIKYIFEIFSINYFNAIILKHLFFGKPWGRFT